MKILKDVLEELNSFEISELQKILGAYETVKLDRQELSSDKTPNEIALNIA